MEITWATKFAKKRIFKKSFRGARGGIHDARFTFTLAGVFPSREKAVKKAKSKNNLVYVTVEQRHYPNEKNGLVCGKPEVKGYGLYVTDYRNIRKIENENGWRLYWGNEQYW